MKWTRRRIEDMVGWWCHLRYRSIVLRCWTRSFVWSCNSRPRWPTTTFNNSQCSTVARQSCANERGYCLSTGQQRSADNRHQRRRSSVLIRLRHHRPLAQHDRSMVARTSDRPTSQRNWPIASANNYVCPSRALI